MVSEHHRHWHIDAARVAGGVHSITNPGSRGTAVGKAGPLDAKTERLVKLALAVGGGLQGAVRSHARRGLAAGLTQDELLHVALLGITTVGWPTAFAGRSWIQEELQRQH